ncbi:hypothetical protein RO07_17775 [Pandoraea pulmonicola]|uniref:Uncharacterized protein n=1 Tax=Pandoraea pulmonicola TaxID=93221 RepID=A0ABM5S2B6_PANPU|nr:hypothetical protein RO07_17775 [Pandoraea pulmonicola]
MMQTRVRAAHERHDDEIDFPSRSRVADVFQKYNSFQRRFGRRARGMARGLSGGSRRRGGRDGVAGVGADACANCFAIVRINHLNDTRRLQGRP